ncbi:FecCD family ABC transporter permease [Allorhizobium undicola]|uniref:FecCD family ABC transporter permease n=1 Tax=Allorhizobium undicola TaxID=78527 RepID=UPI003D358C01
MTDASIVASAIASQRRRERRRWRLLFATALFCCVTLIFDIGTGPSMLSPDRVLSALLRLDGADPMTLAIVNDLRLPMALMALVVGAALGAGGAEIQTLLNNPMASPYTLGLAAAAGLGAAFSIFTGGFGLHPAIAVPLGAFFFSMLASAFLFILAAYANITSTMLVLAGIALLFLFQSLLSLLQFIASPEVGQQILFWLFGSLTKTTWTSLWVTLGVTVFCIVLLFRDAWKLTALRLGEARAQSLGVNLTRLRLTTLILTGLMTSTAISFVGIIGFVGLVAPHVARLLVGEDQRFFLPMSMVAGAAFLSMASVMSKVVIPGALFPVGIVTAMVGVPFFFWIMLSRRR